MIKENMSFEEAKAIINRMDWGKFSKEELEAICSMVKIAEKQQ